MQLPHQPNERGQSLLEAIIGITVLVAGVVTALALGIITVRAGQISESRTIADNYAREGIERVRNMRDSNWLEGVAWDTDLCNAPDETAIPVLAQAMTWSLDWGVNAIDSAGAVVYEREDATLMLRYGMQTTEAVPPDATATPYRRLLTIHPNGNCDLGEATTYTVTSLVEWDEHGATHESELVETLTNWRP